MLRWSHLEISGGFLLLTAALYYLDSSGVVPWALAACTLHELGHVTAIRLLGGRVSMLRLTCVGAELRLSARYPLGAGRQLLAALAGPAVNLLLAPAVAGAGARGLFYLRDSIWPWAPLTCCLWPSWTAGGRCVRC